jgi:hypothetical protein
VDIKELRSPEETALWLIDWCRKNFRVAGMGFVPKLTLGWDGGVKEIDLVPVNERLLATHTFDDAFEVLNKCVPSGLELSGQRYIYRARGKHGGKYRLSSVYHLPGAEGRSACGAVRAGKDGYQNIYKNKPVLRSQQCNHCTRGTVIRQEEAHSGTK